MNEMIQEAVLEAVDSVELSQVYAEYDVLMALSATYMKDMMIQEAATGMSFDGYELIQEAAGDAGTETKAPGRVKKLKEKFISSRFVQWIIRVIGMIRDALKNIGKKKKLTASEQKVMASNVKSMTVGGSQYDVKDVDKWGNSTFNGSQTVGTNTVPGDVKAGKFDSTTSIYDITISGFRVLADPDKIADAVSKFVAAVEQFVMMEIEARSFGSGKTPPVITECKAINKLCEEALNIASKKEYADENYGKFCDKFTKLDDELSKAQRRLNANIGKKGTYYDNNGKAMGATDYAKTLTEDDEANLTDGSREQLKREIVRETAAKELAKAASNIMNLISGSQACLQRLFTDAHYTQYVFDEHEKTKKRIEANNKAASMPSI